MRTSLIGSTISLSLLAFSAQAQTPSFTAASVLNAASMVSGGSIAPGMKAVITGSNLGDPAFFRDCSSSYPLPTSCFGISVLVNGKAAPIFNDASDKLVFQVPFDVGGPNATIQVTSQLSGSTLSSPVVSLPVAATAPGMFTTAGTGSGTAYYFVAGGLLARYSQPVQAGDSVVMFGTGFGATNPAVPAGSLGPNPPAAAVAAATLKINNQSVPVTFAGLEPGNLTGASAGTYELVFTVPSGLTVPAGQMETSYPVIVTVGGVDSPPVNLRVATPPPSISSISPSPVPLSANPQTVLLNGSGFQNGAGLTVHVIGPDGTTTNLQAPNVTFVSSSQLSVQLNVGTTVGTGSVWIINPDRGQSASFTFTVSGTATTPTITSIVTTSSQAPVIAQNTWIEVHGTNLAQVITTWSNSDFSHGLPTTLGGVSATVNGRSAPIFYVSQTQVNILAPFDSAAGTVPVQLNTPNGPTAIKTATEVPTSPAFLVLDVTGHIAAQHLPDYSLLGPSSLNAPGYTFTPARPGETVVLYTVGFGQTNPPVTDQQKGAGPLPTLPAVTIGGTPATVSFAGLSGAGLYQLNVVVPPGSPDGDLPVLASYNGSSTQTNVVLTVKN